MAARKNLLTARGLRALSSAEQKRFGLARGYVPASATLSKTNAKSLFIPRRRAEQSVLGTTFEALTHPFKTLYSGRYEWAMSNFMLKYDYEPKRSQGVKFHVSRAAQQDPRWKDVWKGLHNKRSRRRASSRKYAKTHDVRDEPYVKALELLGLRDPEWKNAVGDSPTRDKAVAA